jgi:hypothetical protein
VLVASTRALDVAHLLLGKDGVYFVFSTGTGSLHQEPNRYDLVVIQVNTTKIAAPIM